MSSPTSTRSRQPRGVPIGGQFATEQRGESTTVLTAEVPADTVFTRRYETLDEKIEAFHGELETAIADLADDENWLAYLDTMSRFHRYSMLNQLLITMQRPDATRVAGYRRWEEFGRHVERGQKGISILAPKNVTIPLLDDAGKPVLDDAGKPKRIKRCVGFTTATVFDVAQTEGEPLPELRDDLSETPPDGLIDDLEASIRDAGFTVAYETLPPGVRGETSPDGRVRISDTLSPAMRAKVLAHELGHIKAGHLEHMDEYHEGHGGQRGRMETEAESIAYATCRANGMSTDVSTISSTYVAGWSRSNPDMVKTSAQTVSKVVKDLLATGSWRNLVGAQ